MFGKYFCLSLLMAGGCATVYKPAPVPGHRPTPSGLPDELRSTITHLSADIGERNCYRPENLEAAATWIERELAATGLRTRRLPVSVPAGKPYDCGQMTVWNIEAEKRGGNLASEVIVVCAHYDSKVATPKWYGHGPPLPHQPGTPGANDNGSGMAALLALARMFADIPTDRTIRFVAVVNEEPPFYKTDTMGSRVYARTCARDKSICIVGAAALETMGCYSTASLKKRVVPMIGLLGLPSSPDYVAFLSNLSSRRFSRQCAKVLREHSPLTVRAFAVPAFPPRISWSDDWSFWQEGIPAFAVTDTAFLRHDDYHSLTDTADRIDYVPMADVVWGLRYAFDALANPDRP